MGIEHGIADVSDVLLDLFVALDPDYRLEGRVRLQYLFPNAIATSGWQHMWDLLVRNGLSSISRFPKWLEGAQSYCYYAAPRLRVGRNLFVFETDVSRIRSFSQEAIHSRLRTLEVAYSQ